MCMQWGGPTSCLVLVGGSLATSRRCFPVAPLITLVGIMRNEFNAVWERISDLSYTYSLMPKIRCNHLFPRWQLHWACAVLAASKMVKYVISLFCSAFEATYQTAFRAEQAACWLYTHGDKNILKFASQYSFWAKVILFCLFAFSVLSEGKREQEMSVPSFLNTRGPFRCYFLVLYLNLYLYGAVEILVPILFSHADIKSSSKQNIIQVCLLSLEYMNAKNPSRYFLHTAVFCRRW